MSDPVLIALITVLGTTVPTLCATLVNMRNIAKTKEKVNAIEANTNHLTEALVKTTKDKAHMEGRAAGLAQGLKQGRQK